MFKPVFEKRDNMPVYHYPLPIHEAQEDKLQGGHLRSVNVLQERNNNLYIHIPFCKSICNFCSFTKWIGDEDKILNYIKYLKQEIVKYSQTPYINQIEFSAVYFGGGTPSLLTVEQIIDLLDTVKCHFNLFNRCEITIEGSPSSFSKKKFEILKQHGVTRISMGIQTLCDDLASIMGLPQKPEHSKKIISDAIETKFDAVSVDLIYNIPTQTIEKWRSDLETAISLGVNQLTLFPLTLAPFTKLGRQIKDGNLPGLSSQEKEFEYYSEAAKILQENGFRQLTNVDWLKPDSKYRYCEQHFANQANILGLGAGAFGEVNGLSYINSGNLEEYYDLISKKLFPIKKCALVKDELPYQYISMSLRCLKLSDSVFKKRFGISMYVMFKEQFKEAEREGLIEIKDTDVYVTNLGTFYLYDLSRKFVSNQHVNTNSFSKSVEMISKS